MVLAAILASASLAAATPPFVATVSPVRRTELRYSYRPGCPVGPAQLRRLRLSFWGFDGARHTGELVAAAAAVRPLVAVFRRLYRERFPIRRMEPIDVFHGSDEASLAADNTAAFNCRYAVAPGPHRWSAHAYGTAIDVDPIENPYLLGGRVHPRAGRRYLARARVRPGMAVPGGSLVAAFASVGWSWGGRWTGSPDYQHFSASGG
ncbi:MAG TPA: M15 family metallopeptidase [Gaiellaceae bacterium]|jgi:hypothetical protein